MGSEIGTLPGGRRDCSANSNNDTVLKNLIAVRDNDDKNPIANRANLRAAHIVFRQRPTNCKGFEPTADHTGQPDY